MLTGQPLRPGYRSVAGGSGGTLYAAAGIYTAKSWERSGPVEQDPFNFLGGWDEYQLTPITAIHQPTISILDGEHVRRVITVTGGNTQPVIDGWTIRNGNATGLITNCYVHGSTAGGCGGGIYVFEASPTISNNIIEENDAVVEKGIEGKNGSGGGIYVDSSAATIINNNEIRNNNSHAGGAGWGGGIFLHDSGPSVSISNNDIHDNDDTPSITYYQHNGSGIMVYSNSGSVVINRNSIYDNVPGDQNYYGTAIGLQFCDDDVVIEDNSIINNRGVTVITLNYSDVILQRNTIIDPEANTGVNISSDTYTGTVISSQLINNIIAHHDYYNIYVNNHATGLNNIILIHNTLSHSQVGLYVADGNTITFDRGIISYHTDHGIYKVGEPDINLTVSNTLFHENTENDENGDPYFTGDPAYIDPSIYDFHLLWNSAAINRVTDGGVYQDRDSDTRPSGGGSTPYDVGADEYNWLEFFLPLLAKP